LKLREIAKPRRQIRGRLHPRRDHHHPATATSATTKTTASSPKPRSGSTTPGPPPPGPPWPPRDGSISAFWRSAPYPPREGIRRTSWPETATESVEKSALLPLKAGRPRWRRCSLLHPPCPRAGPARPDFGRRGTITPHRACCRPPPPDRLYPLAPLAGNPGYVLLRVFRGTREASVMAKSACWLAGAVPTGLSSATFVSGAKAASSALST